MKIFAEVLQNEKTSRGDDTRIVVASVDVTKETDGGNVVMAKLKTQYPKAAYRWHYCNNDIYQPCKIEIIT